MAQVIIGRFALTRKNSRICTFIYWGASSRSPPTRSLAGPRSPRSARVADFAALVRAYGSPGGFAPPRPPDALVRACGSVGLAFPISTVERRPGIHRSFY